MRYFYILSIICCSILLLSNSNKQDQHNQNSFTYKLGGLDVTLDLPEIPYDYNGIELPDHYSSIYTDSEIAYLLPIFDFDLPTLNPNIDNHVATLGRVIFYDENMSFNNTVSCASCHKQANGFADDRAFSKGFDGVLTQRNTLNITDFRTSHYPSLFWDDSSQDIRDASILPLLNGEEMGMTMPEIINRMKESEYYPELFNNAFGKNSITDNNIAEALSQFMMSISSFESKYDKGIENNFADFTQRELNGMNIFRAHCNNCHSDIIPHINEENMDDFESFLFPFFLVEFNGPHNNGLDTILKDLGVANTTGETFDEGKFKTPSLKNVALSSPYMHDGRFETLEEVIDFYSEDLLPHPNSTFITSHFYEQIDTIVQPLNGFKFTDDEKADLSAFLHTLTDEQMITNPMFSDPFVRVISSVDDLAEVDQFKAYPNPFTDILNVEFKNEKSALATIKLFNLNGQLIKHEVTTNNTSLIERDNLPAGTYIVEVLLDDKISNTRIVAE